jgi:hypothetical protein
MDRHDKPNIRISQFYERVKNVVNNQQDATTFSFINLLKSALHVSTVELYQTLYIQSKGAPEDGRICRPKHVGMI